MKKMIQILPILSGILWGATGTFVRFLEDLGLGSLTIVEARLIPAVVIIGIGILIYNKKLFRIRLKDIWIFAGGGILGVVSLNYCYNASISSMTLSMAAVLLCIAPVFVMLFAALFFREKITKKKIICMLVAFLGCVMVSGILEEGVTGGWPVSAVIIGVLSAVCYGLNSTFSKAGTQKGYHALTITIYCFTVAAVFLIPFTDWQVIGSVLTAAPAKMGGFFLLHALLTSVCPYVFFNISLKYVETGKAAILASGEPAAATVFGFFIFHEVPTILSICGIVVVLAALAVLSMPARDRYPG